MRVCSFEHFSRAYEKPAMKIAYAFALVGSALDKQAITHLTAVRLFLLTRPRIDVISVQSENMKSVEPLQTSLKHLGVRPVFVKPIVSPHCRDSSTFRFAFSYTILNIWNLTSYDKILYMDGDLIVLRNLDALVHDWATARTIELRTPTGCATKATRTTYNTGVWGVTPSKNTFQKLHNWLHAPNYRCGIGSQTAANAFGVRHNFTSLSVQYNMKADKGISKCMKQHAFPYVGVVHWSGNVKPVGRITNDPMEQKALTMYRTMYEKVKRQYRLGGRVLTEHPSRFNRHHHTCSVRLGCHTGLGDTLFEVFSAVAVATLHGCKHTAVFTPSVHEKRLYDWSLIQSPFFTISNHTPPPSAWGMPSAPGCGTRGLRWIASQTNAGEAAIRTVLKQVARSVRIAAAASNATQWDATIHLRRGDKLRNNWSSKRSLDVVYDNTVSLLKSEGFYKNYVCSDDSFYGTAFAQRIGGTFFKDASPYYDLAQMLTSRAIVRAAPASQFSLVAAAISGRPLIRASRDVYSRRGETNDQIWIDAGLVVVKEW